MILGIGSDLIDIRRIEKSLERYGERFVARIFTEIEKGEVGRRAAARRLLCQALRRQGSLLQGARHAAWRDGVYWRDMGVVNLPGGKPTMHLTGGAAARLEEMLPPGHRRSHPSDHHGRFSARPGLRHHRGGAVRITLPQVGAVPVM